MADKKTGPDPVFEIVTERADGHRTVTRVKAPDLAAAEAVVDRTVTAVAAPEVVSRTQVQ